ncbi:MAG: UDP-3-O-(3-hydroxymyristoyl)glucosamine N-acyltransferase [Gemmatimonadaceae bacterium]
MTVDHPPDRRLGGEGVVALPAADLARVVGGRLVGDGRVEASGIAPLDRARVGDVSFLASRRYAALCESTEAGVVLVTAALSEVVARRPARIVVESPHDAILSLIPHFHPARSRPAHIHPTASIGRGVRLGAGVSLGPYAVLGDHAIVGDRAVIGPHAVVGTSASVGDDSVIHAGVTLYPGVAVGRRVVIHAGARIGADGFGYVFREGRHAKIPHVGRTVIEDDVEIGANTTIDRGSVDDTVIGAGTKIDNLVHVGHNVRIGRLCLVMAQVGIAGSARLEDGVVLAGQVGMGGHHTVGKGARVGGQSGVFGDVPAGESWSGYPARPHGEALRAQAALFKMAGLMRRLERLLDREESP